jgi:hypothetical protein
MQSTTDAVEQKAMFDEQLIIAQADAAMMKAALDKVWLQLAVLLHTNVIVPTSWPSALPLIAIAEYS